MISVGFKILSSAGGSADDLEPNAYMTHIEGRVHRSLKSGRKKVIGKLSKRR